MTTADEPADGAAGHASARAAPGRRSELAAVVSRPALWERLEAVRVSVVSAPPGSGKTVLLRSWIGQAGLLAPSARQR
jgi:ATP/maltotriose-dependent transcriptional regulator MalT